MAKTPTKERLQKIKTPEFSMPEWQKTVLSIALIYLLNLVLFNDIVFNKKVFSVGGDNSAVTAISKSMKTLEEKEGTLPLWYPYMFGGMPSFASGMYGNIDAIPAMKYQKYFNPSFYVSTAVNFAFLNHDNSWEIGIFFFAGVFMFVLARGLGFGYLISLCAAVSYMYCNFFVASMAAGHGGKVRTIAYMPLVVWSVVRFFEKRSLLNWSLMGLVLGLFFQEGAHTQIIYYTFLMLGIYGIVFAVDNFKNNKPGIIKNGLGFVSAMLVGLGFGALAQISLYVYSDVTMRGLAPAIAETTEMAGSGGMTFDYITMWSFHPLESITFFVPNFFGLDSPIYWGWMTFTSSAFYFGLVPMLAGIVGAIYRRNTITKFLWITAIFALLVSFGRFFEPLFKLMITILPFFEKFRVPSMILTLFIFAVTVLSCYGLAFIFNPTPEEKEKRGRFSKIALYVLIGAAAILILALIVNWSGKFSYSAEGEKYYNASQLVQLKSMRADMLASGLMRFAILALITVGMVVLYLREKINAGIALAVLLAATIADTITLNKKILRPQSRGAAVGKFRETETIRFLKSEPGQFRIFSLLEHAQQGSPQWGYFGLESVSGYSPAKMRIFQDIIDFSLYKWPDPEFPINKNVLNMLNVKYVVSNQAVPQGHKFLMKKLDQESKIITYENKGCLPRAFFVKNVQVITERPKIIDQLNKPEFDPAVSAIIEHTADFAVEPFDSSRAEIGEVKTDRIAVKAYVDKPSFMVLSEVYYPHGWKAYVDGRETEIYKTNYILRGIAVPAGEHTIEFVFAPREFTAGIWVSSISFFGIIIMLVASGVREYQKRKSLPQ